MSDLLTAMGVPIFAIFVASFICFCVDAALSSGPIDGLGMTVEHEGALHPVSLLQYDIAMVQDSGLTQEAAVHRQRAANYSAASAMLMTDSQQFRAKAFEDERSARALADQAAFLLQESEGLKAKAAQEAKEVYEALKAEVAAYDKAAKTLKEAREQAALVDVELANAREGAAV